MRRETQNSSPKIGNYQEYKRFSEGDSGKCQDQERKESTYGRKVALDGGNLKWETS